MREKAMLGMVRPIIAAMLMLLVGAVAAVAGGTEPSGKPQYTDIGVEKHADRQRVTAGESVSWTVTVTNHGTTPVALDRIVVHDPGVALSSNSKAPDVLDPGASSIWTGASATDASNCPRLHNTVEVWMTEPAPESPSKPAKKGADTPDTKGDGAPGDVRVPDARPENDRSTAEVEVVCPPAPPPSPPSEDSGPGAPVVETTPPAASKPPRAAQVCPRPHAHIGMVAPRKLRIGRPMRVAISVHNRSKSVAAERVVARYRLPRGFALLRRPRGVGMQHGVVVIPRTRIAPGRSHVVWLTLRSVRPVARRLPHRATVRARCDTTRAARTLTTLQRSRPLPRNPRVTG